MSDPRHSSETETETASDPSVIARDIEQTRGEMTETIDAIQRRLEPEQVTEYVKDVSHFVILEVKDAIRELTGQAVGALRAGAAKTDDKAAKPASTSGAIGISGMPSAHGGQNGTPGQTKQKVRQATGHLQDQAGHIGEQMQQKAGQMQQQSAGLWQKLQANPIAIGALGVALGTVAGAMIPETEKENRLMGETRDRVVGNVQQVADQTIETAKTVAEETGNAVKREAQG